MTTILASLGAGLVFLESWPAGQFLLGRPALLLPLLGWLTGAPELGLWMGLCLDLLLLRQLPMGAALPPDNVMGGVLGFLAVRLADPGGGTAVQVAAGLVIALVLCYIAPLLTEVQRRINGGLWYPRFRRAAEAGDTALIERLFPVVLLQTWLLAAAVSWLLLMVCRPLAPKLASLFLRFAESAGAWSPGLPWLLAAASAGTLLRLAGGRAGGWPALGGGLLGALVLLLVLP